MEDARLQHARSSFRVVGSRASNERGNRPERKKSAAERLEADKIKYVKSAHVREKRITAASISPHNDSTGTHSMSSTGSPTRIDDEEDDPAVAGGAGAESRLPLAQSLPLPQVDGGGKQRRPPVAKPRASLALNEAVDQSSSKYQSKSMQNKFYDCVYKAKESLRPVVHHSIRFEEIPATTTTTTITQENSRQSRTSSRSTKPRSSSVGPNLRTSHHSERFSIEQQQFTKSKGVISPRTQLKQARDGLKKVKNDHRFGVRSVRPNHLDVERPEGSGATFVDSLKNSAADDQDMSDGSSAKQQPPPSFQKQHRSKPLAIIENNIVLSCTAPKRPDAMPMKAFAPSPAINRKAAMEAAAAEMESAESTRRAKHNKMMYADGGGGGCTKRSAAVKKSAKEDRPTCAARTTTEVATNNSQARRAQVPKLMSPSAYHHQQQHSSSGGGTNELMVRNILPNTPRQRRSWSKNPNEARKSNHHHNSRRAALQQEGNRPGSRKSISERLEEILTPLEDMDTLNMPPPPVPVASSGHSTTPTACYENTPTESNTVIAAALHNNQTAILAESPMPAVVPVSNNAAGQTVYGRVDQAPSAGGGGGDYKSFQSSSNSAAASGRSFSKSVPQSPSLAPRTRREVAPTDKKRSGEHQQQRMQDGVYHDRHTPAATNSSGDDIRAQSTLQSHNTSSSAATSADVSKPLTALTASDLKPRRTKRNTTSAVTPLRAAHPYPPYNCHAEKLRRQAATPPQSPLRPPSTSSRRNSYHQQHRGSNGSNLQDRSEVAKLNNFFATMGGYMPSHSSNENICFNITDCESDFSFAGASAYVREDDEYNMEVEMGKPGAPYQAPSVSIIEKHARIMQWIMSCRSQMNQQQQQQQSSNHLSCYVAPKESSV